MSSVHPAFKAETWMEVEECCQCGIAFAMPRDFRQRCLDNRGVGSGKAFFCPRGHKQWYTGKTEKQRLKDQLEQKERQVEVERTWRRKAQEARDHERRRAAAFKGHLTKTKNRVGKGVCPCCNRTFANLQRHMDSKHPDYAGGDES